MHLLQVPCAGGPERRTLRELDDEVEGMDLHNHPLHQRATLELLQPSLGRRLLCRLTPRRHLQDQAPACRVAETSGMLITPTLRSLPASVARHDILDQTSNKQGCLLGGLRLINGTWDSTPHHS